MMRKPPFPEEVYKNEERIVVPIVTREEWGAVPPLDDIKFDTYPLTNVVFGYTETEPCTTKEACMEMMRELQKKHMSEGLSDIRYSWVLGADWNLYEGRGWTRKAGKHPRFPYLDGNNVELVHSGKRGKLPEPELSMGLWHTLERRQYEGHITLDAEHLQDFDDDIVEDDIETLYNAKANVDALEMLRTDHLPHTV